MSNAAERMRRHRERQRAGRRVLRVEVDEAAIEDALVNHGYLDPLRADSSKSVERALAALIDRLCTVTRNAGDR
jgi:hypothetical protein